MEERRRNQRYAVQDVRGMLLLSTEAKIVNMSLTGMAVETESRLRLGRLYSLKLQHESELAIPLSGTVVWCQLRQSKSQNAPEGHIAYVSGLQFEGILSEKAHDLLAFLQSAAVVSVQTRVCGRFRARFVETINLNTEYEFEVRKVSRSGMLIVTDLVAEQGSAFDMEVQLDDGLLRARSRVVYVRPTSTRQTGAAVELGVEFTEMSEPDRALLTDFIGRQIV
ncbi:MAG: PilZ domain-containing protein [Thermoanaerobaculaceae bacterium]|nr:PilZ domain-containing protein [Thermoanaerobaculaceae bacterium]MDI9621840.1 PilZ domain-containing protein [Acidobacteriota bacterium]NLH11060.1 PilZ domain-containing protein [Holophagae bacterium]HPW54445.1 PilZ domain-containing protein [Thermoanaerobaculaceae bacterium]